MDCGELMDRSGLAWTEMDQNGLKQIEIDQCGLNWSEVDQIGWTEVDRNKTNGPNGLKWTKMLY